MSRFFGIHVLVLPLALAGLLAGHLLLVHQLGLANPRRPEPRIATPEVEQEPLRPFFPHYLIDELVAWYVILAILVILASLFPAGLEGQANPLETPAHTKPEWYYLGVYELLKLVPIKVVGILMPIVGVGVLVVWPFLDRSPEVLVRRRKVVVGAATLVLAGLVALTIWGYVS
ncbi:MAG: cytochrome b N-terminal domain-containing protein, partial [Candidatus Limnocylindrales bacterium]